MSHHRIFDARTKIQTILCHALEQQVSDIHLEPQADGYELRWRCDGLLKTVDHFDASAGENLVNRLMVAAQLLTYRRDIPQEGRASEFLSQALGTVEVRIAIMPTTHGLRAVVRMPAELIQPRSLDALDLPPAILQGLKQFSQADMGMLLLCGPAGSGKTTTIYALLEFIRTHQTGLSLVSIEDPVERDLPGITQIQTAPFGELTHDKVLRSVLRQDPQVLALGEIRDAQTASIAVQAALSGHRLISTLHAATPQTALVRLLEMRIAPYQITSSVFGIAAMRLVRRGDHKQAYRGRVPVAEFAYMDAAVRERLLAAGDAAAIRQAMESQQGFKSMAQVAAALVEQGVTDADEIRRAIGIELNAGSA